MSNRGAFLFHRIAMLAPSFVVAMFLGAPVFAQQKPMVIEPNLSASGAIKAITVINKSGSYILNRNIVDNRAGFDGVAVTASNVTIDLEGFTLSSTLSTTGNGFNATGQSNVVIRNGIITGFGGAAIIVGNSGSVSAITATLNGSGISCGIGCLASGNVIQGNTGLGLNFADNTSGYVGNILQGNNNGGAQISSGTSLNQNVCNGTAC